MEQQKELDSLQLKYQARAKELGISASALQQSSALPFVKARCSVGTEIVVRVLQWNLLAEGLSNDGFLVRNVLSEESDEAFKSVVEQVRTLQRTHLFPVLLLSYGCLVSICYLSHLCLMSVLCLSYVCLFFVLVQSSFRLNSVFISYMW
jgi:hypothetical protein